MKDIGRVELGAKNQNVSCSSTASRPWTWRSFSCPTPTRWTRATSCKAKMDELAKDFPDGVDL